VDCRDLKLGHMGSGVVLILIAGILNAGLGYYLVHTGRRINSLILEANGKHVSTDNWTSSDVVGGPVVVLLTHWKPFDPDVDIVVAAASSGREADWSGIRQSAPGLLRS
jgi:divalent metal cation (Fe/Co/Zn/Cd) transporter